MEPHPQIDREGGRPVATQAEAYVWHDGRTTHTVWLKPDLVAEFEPGPDAEHSPVRAALPGARALPGKQSATVRLWRLDTPAGPTATRSLRTAHPSGRYSPVFQDSPSGEGRKRALPGNIIVHLEPSWSPAEAEVWLADKGFEIVQRLALAGNVYVLRTGPGLEALEAANALYGTPGVVAAYPDWWQEVSTR